jgi:hypothetical protein
MCNDLRISIRWAYHESLLTHAVTPTIYNVKKGGNNESEAFLSTFITLRQADLVLSPGTGYPDSTRCMWGQQQHEQQPNPNHNNYFHFRCSYRHSNQCRLNAYIRSRHTITSYACTDGNRIETNANSHKTAATYTDAYAYTDALADSHTAA